MNEQLVSALVAAVVSAIVSLGVALAQLRQSRETHRSQVQQDIGGKYDRMVDYRLRCPTVLSLAHRWTQDCFRWIYDHTGPEGDAWAIYYGYVELITFYCTAVLYAREHRLIDSDAYASQHEPLMRLLLAEHYPIFSAIIRSDGYVSKQMVTHVARLKADGWNWEQEHLRLTT